MIQTGASYQRASFNCPECQREYENLSAIFSQSELLSLLRTPSSASAPWHNIVIRPQDLNLPERPSKQYFKTLLTMVAIEAGFSYLFPTPIYTTAAFLRFLFFMQGENILAPSQIVKFARFFKNHLFDLGRGHEDPFRYFKEIKNLQIYSHFLGMGALLASYVAKRYFG